MNRKKIIIICIVAAVLLVGSYIYLRQSGISVDCSSIFSGEDCWLCQNGQWVKHGNPSAPKPVTLCGTAVENADILVSTPQPYDVVKSPLTIKGKARGGWFFEAVFPACLLNEAGQNLGCVQMRATGNWMSSDLVPFEGQLEFDPGASESGKIVLNKDNPSGLPENAASLEVPIRFAAKKTMFVKAYFNNSQMDPEASCNKVFSVQREVPSTDDLGQKIRLALEELLKGPTSAEKAQGFSTSINSGVKINKVNVHIDLVEVDFDERLEEGVGGSCRVAAIRNQIDQTIRQFFGVRAVSISINGRTGDILQP